MDITPEADFSLLFERQRLPHHTSQGDIPPRPTWPLQRKYRRKKALSRMTKISITMATSLLCYGPPSNS
jgi:hypothetical protein